MEREKNKIRKQPLLIGLLLVLLGSLVSTFAANLTLNRGGPVQFAQGVYKIDACQSYISIYLNPQYTNPGDGNAPTPGTYVGQIIINSLDTDSCANTRLGIKLFGGAGPLAIYEGADGNPIYELTLNIDDSDNVTIPLQSPEDADSIDQPIFDNENGSWTVNILKRLALTLDVTGLTLESGPQPSESPST